MTTDLETLTDTALDAFWYIIAKHFPEAKYGDLSPLTTIRFIEAAKTAVKEWVWANVPRGRRKKAAHKPRGYVTHSPGPWFVDRESPYSPICIKPYPGCIVCDIEGTDAESEANASLIAAAPELLEALECLLRQTVDMDLAHGIKLTEGEQEARVRGIAAIAKANAAQSLVRRSAA